MSESMEQWVGIDVSQAHLDVYLYPLAQQWRSLNSELEISEIIKPPSLHRITLVVLEATGGMEPEVHEKCCVLM